MKQPVPIVLATLVVAGLATGAFRSHPVSTASATPVTASHENRHWLGLKSRVEPTPEEKLIRETASALREFQRLRALPDDIENFRKSAELENDFMAKLDASTAPMLIQRMSRGFTDSYFGSLALRTWAFTDRAAAAAWMADHPSTLPTTAAALEAGWYTEDKKGLQSYLDGLPDSSWKSNLLKSAGEEAFVSSDPTGSIALLNQISGADPRRDELYAGNLTAWAMKDPGAANQWVAQVDNPALQQALYASVAIGEAHASPQTAVALLNAKVIDPGSVTTATTAIARIWAVSDPSAAADWVSQFPPGATRTSALEGLLAVWTGANSAQAIAWQKSINDPVLRTQAAQVLDQLEN